MAIQSETNSPSRRALLAGALGGIGAWAAGAIGRASPVQATDGQALVVGQSNTTAAVTVLQNTSTNAHLLFATTTGGGGALIGQSSVGRGVEGDNFGSQAGVLGSSIHGTGVLGYGGQVAIPAAKADTAVYGLADRNSSSTGVWGNSPAGHGVHGQSASGWAGYFEGRIFANSYLELRERSNPSAPNSNRARLYVRDNGSGKTQLCVRFPNGVVRVLATM
jgi:hypothetical protein